MVTHVALTLPRGERVRDRQPVRLESAEGQVIWAGIVDRSSNGSSAAQDATVRVPASMLPVGDYVLTIADGTAGQPSFFFRVR